MICFVKMRAACLVVPSNVKWSKNRKKSLCMRVFIFFVISSRMCRTVVLLIKLSNIPCQITHRYFRPFQMIFSSCTYMAIIEKSTSVAHFLKKFKSSSHSLFLLVHSITFSFDLSVTTIIRTVIKSMSSLNKWKWFLSFRSYNFSSSSRWVFLFLFFIPFTHKMNDSLTFLRVLCRKRPW